MNERMGLFSDFSKKGHSLRDGADRIVRNIITVKKLLITAGCIILLLVPTLIACVYYSAAQKHPVTSQTVTGMEMTSPDGTVYTFDANTVCEEDSIGKNALAFFMSMNENAEKIAELPELIDTAKSYSVVFTSRNKPYSYQYYFTADSGYAYFRDYSGAVYKIAAQDAVRFLQSSYAYCMYSSSAAPALAIGGETVMPRSMEWQYASYDAEFRRAEVKVADTVSQYPVRGSLALSFSVQPDWLNVRVLSGGETIYDGLYESIPGDLFAENMTYSVELSAKWYSDPGKDYFGEASYAFQIKVYAPPVFYLGATSIDPGEFAVITGLNVTDPGSVSFSCEPAINFTPVFFAEGESVYALIPISMNIGLEEIAESYHFTLQCDGVTQEMVLHINPKTFRAQTYEVTATTCATYRSEKARNDFKASLADVLGSRLAERYFGTETCGDPVAGREIRTGFGLYRTLSATAETYRHEGVDYVVNIGDHAIAAMKGKVTFVGNLTLSGLTVVIDHGFGLKTLYAHLSSTAVSVGDVVEKGADLGVVGKTGFTVDTNLHFGMYVFDVPVSPYDVMENGVLLTKK